MGGSSVLLFSTGSLMKSQGFPINETLSSFKESFVTLGSIFSSPSSVTVVFDSPLITAAFS
jgi:hypothetical protein